MMPTREERSRDAALDVLLGLRPSIVSQSTDPTVADLLTDDLVRDIFREAWDNQFDEDRSAFQRSVREIVTLAIDARTMRGGGE
jgi:hypothetical protein